jgi:hypothetical protein
VHHPSGSHSLKILAYLPMSPATHLSRRSFLRLAAFSGLAAAASACSMPDQLGRMLASTTPVTPIPWATKTPSPVTNLWPAGSDLASSLLVANPPRATKYPDQSEAWNGIQLEGLAGRDFFASLTTPLAALGSQLFTAGQDYLASYYIYSTADEPVFFWMRPLAGLNVFGHGPKLATRQVRRVWQVVRAVAPDQLAQISDPSLPPEAQTEANLYWLFQGPSNPGWSVDLRLGGFMLEALGELPRSGVAVMGDSTTEGFSAGIDHPMAHEWTTWAAALLNVPFYNRAHHGWTTGRMREEWNNRISPLAQYCRFCILQGGLNDIALGESLESMQANFNWMWQKAEEQGMLPILTTATPYNVIVNGGRESVRQALNAWIQQTFVRVLDIDAVVRDPSDPSSLRRIDGWYGDGGHYDQDAKRAIGEYVANWEGWDFPQPGPFTG